MRIHVHEHIGEVDQLAWDSASGDNPFVSHGYLRALEESGAVGAHSTWQPRYLAAYDDKALLGAVAAYVKHDSRGEYIFDFAWAQAAERAGLPYYPKLVVAAPATAASGPRILASDPAVRRELIAAVRELSDRAGCHSIHWLFCTGDEQTELASADFWPRDSLQFHWHNANYQTFDDFLTTLTSRRRKQIKKERARVASAGITCVWRQGREISNDLLADVYRYYLGTVRAHRGTPYVNAKFFELAHAYCPAMRIVEIIHTDATGSRRIGAALFFESPTTLYGRYWGADRAIEFLHFEAAYYTGIDHCIARGLRRFEAGAQGEHKLLRGFVPSATYSAHWLRHSGLGAAVQRFLAAEQRQVADEMQQLATYGPYRANAESEAPDTEL